jgi:hypothetical protein
MKRIVEQADAENPAMTLQLTIDIPWRRVSDPDRWALKSCSPM